MAAMRRLDDQTPKAFAKALVRRKNTGGRADFTASTAGSPSSTASCTRCRRRRCMSPARRTPTGVAPSAIASSSARSAIGTLPSVAANSASSSDRRQSPTHACAASRSTRRLANIQSKLLEFLSCRRSISPEMGRQPRLASPSMATPASFMTPRIVSSSARPSSG